MLLLLELMFYFGVATFTAVLVHQDGLVGVRQDWLVRHVRRRDLLAAKLLFVLLAAQLPLFLANLAGGLIDGFALSLTLTAAATENLYFLLGFTLPIFAFVSMTRNLTAALGGAFALFVAVTGLELSVTGWNAGNLVTQVAPWGCAFGLEKALSGAPPVNPSLRFDPTLGSFQSPVTVEPASNEPQVDKGALRGADKGAQTYIPLRVSGVAQDSILKIDRASVHLVGASGKDEGGINPKGDQGGFEITNEGATDSPSISYFEPIRVRSSVFSRIKDTPVTLRIDYSATMLRLASTDSLPAVDANERLAGVGWCETALKDDRTAVEVRCLAAGKIPQCSTFLLTNPATGAHNPGIYGCLDDYAPYFGRYKPPDLLRREGANLSFRDTAGLVHYPVDGSQIASARVVMKNYAAAGHLTIPLTILPSASPTGPLSKPACRTRNG